MELTCRAPLPDFALADGDVETEIQALKYGAFEHARFGRFALDAKVADEMVRNFDAEWGNTPGLFVTLGHPKDLDAAKAAGWITKLRKTDDGIMASVRLNADTVRQVKAGEFKYFSPTFVTDGKSESGKPVGAKLLTGGITNFPFLKGMKPFELSAVLDGEADNKESTQMTENEIKALVAQETAGVVSKLTEADEKIKALTDEIAAVKAAKSDEAKQLTERIGSLEGQNKALVDGLAARDAADAIQSAIDTGKATPAEFGDGWEKDPIKALSDAGYDGLPGFTRRMARVRPNSAVDLSARRSSSAAHVELADGPEPSDEDIARIGFKDRTEFRKYAAMGVGGDPRKVRES